MKTYRYGRWDGTLAEFSLAPEEVLDAMSRLLMEGLSVEQALEWMKRFGFQTTSFRVMGTEELRAELDQELEELRTRYHLRDSTREIRERLDDILRTEERAVLEEHGLESARLNDFLTRKHEERASLSAEIEAFGNWPFEDEDAGHDFLRLLDELDDLRKLERFVESHGADFRGPEAADYETAQTVRKRFEQISLTLRALAEGNLGSISPEQLEELLGNPDAARSLVLLRDMQKSLADRGLLRDARAELTPRAIRRLGAQALADVFASLPKDARGDHSMDARGGATPKPDETHAFRFGDPFDLDVVKTVFNGVLRSARGGAGAKIPVELEVEDFEVRELDYATRTTTVLLIDLSWSMSWEGRFGAAKRVALALDHMVRTRFPRDDFFVVGFSTRAKELQLRSLPEVTWDAGEPFTNLQAGLLVAERLIAKHPSKSPQILVITDGQPTAYYIGQQLHAELPMGLGSVSALAVGQTMKQVHRLTRLGVTINTFMLDDAPELVGFVERMTEVNRGRAFFTRPSELGSYVMLDFVSRRPGRR